MKDAGSSVLTFAAQVISSIAWPLTVLSCVILLRRHLFALIPLLRTVKYSDIEIKFGKEVAELAKAADKTSLPQNRSQERLSPWEDLLGTANIRPRGAIRAAWRRVEDAIVQAAHARQVEIADAAQSMPMVIGAILLNQGMISEQQYELLSKLRVLVKEAEHAPPDSLSTESAAEFIGLAWRLAASLQVGAS
jgi:hypothetical protein